MRRKRRNTCTFAESQLNLQQNFYERLELFNERPEAFGEELTDRTPAPRWRKILMIIKNLTLLFALILGATLFSLKAGAQTCRVSCGTTADGTQAYIEVYEYDYVMEKPCFPGGDSQLVRFINEHRRYPQEAYRKGVQGRVTCSFVVNADGSVSNIQVLKGVEKTLNEEAKRIFAKMPQWQPGRIDGVPVPVRVIWPVPFRK